jgi:hypothetical protein
MTSILSSSTPTNDKEIIRDITHDDLDGEARRIRVVIGARHETHATTARRCTGRPPSAVEAGRIEQELTPLTPRKSRGGRAAVTALFAESTAARRAGFDQTRVRAQSTTTEDTCP